MQSDKRFTFKTWGGKEIPVFGKIDIPETLIQAINKLFRQKYGKTKERKSADSRYNCHGMTFVGRLGWISDIDTEKGHILITNSKGFIKDTTERKDIIEDILKGNHLHRGKRINNIKIDTLDGCEDIRIGDIVVYKDSIRGKEGSKILNVEVLSKMGYGGEYFHLYNNVPQEFGLIVEFWTDRLNTL